MSKMISKWGVVTHLFLLMQFLHGQDVDVEQEDIKAVATYPNQVMGDPTHTGELPFSVIFYEKYPRVIRFGSYLSPICSGSIISVRWVLTTAMPLGDYAINTYFMLAGVHRIARNVEEVMNYTNNIYKIDTMVVHPKWHEYNIHNVGMARTAEPLKFGTELGTLRIPFKYDVRVLEGENDTVCSLNIWAATAKQHLLWLYQSLSITKQKININVLKDPQLFCRDLIFANYTLCLIQFDPHQPHDVCALNLGAIVQCDCKAVGLFTGVRGKLDCVNMPPLLYTAVNLTHYVQWIKIVSDAPIPKDHYFHTISSAFFMCLNFNLTYFTVFLNICFRLRLKIG